MIPRIPMLIVFPLLSHRWHPPWCALRWQLLLCGLNDGLPSKPCRMRQRRSSSSLIEAADSPLQAKDDGIIDGLVMGHARCRPVAIRLRHSRRNLLPSCTRRQHNSNSIATAKAESRLIGVSASPRAYGVAGSEAPRSRAGGRALGCHGVGAVGGCIGRSRFDQFASGTEGWGDDGCSCCPSSLLQ